MGYYRVTRLDENLMEIGELENVRSASVSRDCSGASSLLESLDITIDSDTVDVWDGWVRVDREDDPPRHIGVFRLEPDSATYDHGRLVVKALGYSVLKPAEEESMKVGSFIAKGADAVGFAASMLSVCPGRVSHDGSAFCPEAIVFTDSDTRLSAAWAALDAVGWCMRLDGMGNVSLIPLPESVSRVITAFSPGIVPSIELGGELSYTRADDGQSDLFDLVEIRLPRLGIEGVKRVVSQSIECGAAVSVKEVCR